jgi:hypothetical protein
MNRRSFVATLGSFTAALATAAASGAAAAARARHDLVLVAELLEAPLPAPAPGTARIASVARYRVLKVLKGHYAHDEMLVGFDGTTGLPGAAGEHHRLEVTDRFPPRARRPRRGRVSSAPTGAVS